MIKENSSKVTVDMLSLFATLFLIGALVVIDIRVPSTTVPQRAARYLFVALFNHDLFLIVQLNLNLVRDNVEPFQPISYLGIMLFRYLLLPLVFVVAVDLYNHAPTRLRKTVTYFGTVIVLTLLDLLSEVLGMTTLLKWNYFYTAVAFTVTLTAVLAFERFYKWLLRREGAPV